jgi:hypothetical protein
VRRTVTRDRAAPVVACGEEEVGEACNAPRFLEQQRGGAKGSPEPTSRRRIPTVTQFTAVGDNRKCGGLGGS